LILDKSGTPKESAFPFDSTFIDLYNPDAWEWYVRKIAALIKESGAEGAMVDLGEGESLVDVLIGKHNDLDGFQQHNGYVRLYQDAVEEAIRRAGKTDNFFAFMRTGTIETVNKFPLWLGDQNVTYDEHDGLKSVVNGTLNLMASNPRNPHVGCDTGGWTSYPFFLERTPELFKRWADLSAFLTTMRTHPGLSPQVNAQVWHDDVSDYFLHCVGLFEALKPIRDEAIALAQTESRPYWLAADLVHQNLPESATYHFYVGEDLYVAPVLDELYGRRQRVGRALKIQGKSILRFFGFGSHVVKAPDGQRVTTQVVLPKLGEDSAWVDIWTGLVARDIRTHVEADTTVDHALIEVDASLGRPPAFIRQGSKHERAVIDRISRNQRLLQEVENPKRHIVHK